MILVTPEIHAALRANDLVSTHSDENLLKNFLRWHFELKSDVSATALIFTPDH